MIMIKGILPCWNMDIMEKWRFAFLLVTNDKSYFGASLFSFGEFLRRFLSVWLSSFVLTSLRKGYFLRRRRLMAEIAVLMFLFFFVVVIVFFFCFCFFFCFFFFGSRLLAEFQCWIDLCMMDGHNFSSIMLTFFYGTSPLRTSAPLRKHKWATIDQRYVSLSFPFQFALKLFHTSGSVSEMLAFTKYICCVDVHDI